MVEKNYVCEECGEEFAIEYVNEAAYKSGRKRQYCPKCVRQRYIRIRNKIAQERKTPYQKEPQKDSTKDSQKEPSGRYLMRGLKEVSEACDRALERRKARQGLARLELSVLAPMENARKAVEYGESAAKRYMKGVKDGN